MFLNGDDNSMKTIPMLKICTPPPDIYNMNACIGNDFAGDVAKSHALFSFNAAYESADTAEDLACDLETCYRKVHE